ncbi:MAG TPA: 16S rRNA (adenine(1518)-N(6)/adenine(1519)-N(6))-dimethyltransferase RsmA [Candidatus Dormibacteraeota bacterium]|nr:16S rRNA (adenine(1518)-N(6)/adenine(1519)-N(6))-dimethyltransferase RsmA [Candidatus Dormibacteraeota bacterium]
MSPQRLGQHFLADAGWRGQILDRIAPAKDQVWVEIGAGSGQMTRDLAMRAGRVIAIEIDRALAQQLRENTEGLPVEVVEGDVLRLDLVGLAAPRFRVYGSLPYYITSPILRKLFLIADHLDEIDVVIQWEVARRVAAQPGGSEYGWLSLLSRFYTSPEILLRIPPGAFRPPPQVDSALVLLTPPGERARLKLENEERFLKFALQGFGQKRKTLANNLKTSYGAQAVRETLQALGLEMQARAEQIGIADMAKLFRILEIQEGRNA